VAAEGNLSVRLDGERLMITPAGARKDELQADDPVIVPLEEQERPSAELRPSSDLAVHRGVYAARGDVTAVAHAHLPASLALTLAGEAPDPSVLPETALLLPRLPFVQLAAPGSTELAGAVAAAFRAGLPELPGLVLLERHGAIAVGSSLDQAVDRLEMVELLCRVWRDARLLGWSPPPT
jgi:L-fuculose-phosphate aldolase